MNRWLGILKELLYASAIGIGAIMFFMGFFFYLYNIRYPTFNLQLEIFLIYLMIIGAFLAIGLILLYYLYLRKRWYGN